MGLMKCIDWSSIKMTELDKLILKLIKNCSKLYLIPFLIQGILSYITAISVLVFYF